MSIADSPFLATTTSRDINMLLSVVRDKVRLMVNKYKIVTGHELLVTCTTRNVKDQAIVFKAGSSNAAPGYSWHQWGCAADIVPMIAGKPLWTTHDKTTKLMVPEWTAVGLCAKESGLEWAGNWHSFKEYAHVQYTGGLVIDGVVANPFVLETLK